MKLVLATKNPGKLKELKELAGSSPTIDLVLAPDDFDPEETGSTFLENAIIKARAAALMTGTAAIADDSGIVVDALDGRPGIKSARYCEGDDGDRRRKLLDEMQGVPKGKRQARFVCALAMSNASGEIVFTTQAAWEGQIAFNERGTNGFGYDPIFLPDGETASAAELSSESKNAQSHRGQAFKNFLKSRSAGDR